MYVSETAESCWLVRRGVSSGNHKQGEKSERASTDNCSLRIMGRWIVTYATRIIHFTKQRLIDICAITGSIRASLWPQFARHVFSKTMNSANTELDATGKRKERKIPLHVRFKLGQHAYLNIYIYTYKEKNHE